jgi:hypothetical protein
MKVIKEQICHLNRPKERAIKVFVSRDEYNKKGYTTQGGEETMLLNRGSEGTCLFPCIVLDQEQYDALPIAEYY